MTRPRTKLRAVLTHTIALTLISLVALTSNASGQTSAYQVKVAFLFNFLKFIEFSMPRSPEQTHWNVCARGTAELLKEIRLLEGKVVNERSVRATELRDVDLASSCDVIYLGVGESRLLTQILPRTSTHSVLLVGEDKDFIESGGVIAYHLINNRIRFRIDPHNAVNQKLLVSSQLLKLALAEE